MSFHSVAATDVEEIRHLFTVTFTDSESQQEGDLIGKLIYELITETVPMDWYGFMVEEEGSAVGAIIFSRLSFESDIEVFILAPVAVMTAYQGRGIGQSLIKYGIEKLRGMGVEMVVTYGDPSFYTKVGFQQITEETIQAPLTLSMPFGWMAQSLTGDVVDPISGPCRCVKALHKQVYW